MRRRILYIAAVWFVIAAGMFVFYLLRELGPLKEFIAWAASVWEILGVLGMAGIATTTWIFKHYSSPTPVVFFRSCGAQRLAKDSTQQYQRSVWWYEITISNPSSKHRLGIQRIVLTWGKARDERKIAAFTPTVGDIDTEEDEIEPVVMGEIGSAFNLEPNEVRAGKLVFVTGENRFMAPGQFGTEILKLTDNRGHTVTFEAKVNDILS